MTSLILKIILFKTLLLMFKYFKNYKTTLPAVLLVGCVIIYWCNIITTEQFQMGMAALTSLGLLGAKDLDVK